MGDGPLAGLRVLELTDETGRFVGKLLAETGASVVRLTSGFAGAPMTGAAGARGGVLDWWYDGGKQSAPLDLDSHSGRADYRRLAETADIVIETAPPGRLAELGLDHTHLVDVNPQLVQVSLTPFGRSGPWAHWQTSDLVAGAIGGVLSLSGTADRPIAAWGRQNFNFASMYACICGLAGVHCARETGRGQHIDLALHEVVTCSIENLFFQWWFPDVLPLPQRALRQGSLHWLGAYVVANAKTGACNIAPAPHPGPLFEWMADEGDAEGAELSTMTIEQALTQMERVMSAIKRFALTKESGELFQEAQRRHVAFGEVQTVAQVADNPQYRFRGTFRDVDGFADVRIPGPYARFHGSPAPAPQPPPETPTSVDAIVRKWAAVERSGSTADELRHRGPSSAGKPLEGVRIVDFTWVLAGPHGTRIMGDLGADVLKFQTADRATLVNSPDFPYFYVWNRSKRLVSLNMKREEGREIIRKIIESADVLIENFSAGVLARWGLDYETVRSWNPRIVYVTMSGPGHDGPWSKMITYAPTIHALCGLTYLSNPPDRLDVGPGFSLNDHAAGMLSAVAVLSALESRRRSGVGQTHRHRPDGGRHVRHRTRARRLLRQRPRGKAVGNADPFGQWCPNEVYRCGDRREVAITCRTDDEWRGLCDAVAWSLADLALDRGLATVAGRLARVEAIDAALAQWCEKHAADAVVELLQALGVPAGRVQDAGDLMADPQLNDRNFWRSTDHAVFGQRPYDRFPAIWSETDLEPYVLSGAYIGEHNFEVFTQLAGLSDEQIGEGMGDGLFA